MSTPAICTVSGACYDASGTPLSSIKIKVYVTTAFTDASGNYIPSGVIASTMTADDGTWSLAVLQTATLGRSVNFQFEYPLGNNQSATRQYPAVIPDASTANFSDLVNLSTGAAIIATDVTTDSLPEGLVNLYFTTPRAAAAAPVQSVNTQTGAVVLTTTDVAEGSNLYYTNAKADARITAQKAQPNGLASLDSSGLVPLSELPSGAALPDQTGNAGKYLTTDGTDPSWGSVVTGVTSVNTQTGVVVLTTDNVAEGSTNLYATAARAKAAAVVNSLGGSQTDQAPSVASVNTALATKQATGNYVTALTGDVTASGPGSATATLASTAVTPGSYTTANITVDAKGRITAAANGSAGSTSPLTTKGDLYGFDTTNNRLPVGSNTYVLTADSTQALGVKWAAPAATGVTSVSGTAPVVSSGGATPAISIPAATNSVDGYLTATDHTTFATKQAAGNYITATTGDVVATGPGSAAATIQTGAVTTSKIAAAAVDLTTKVTGTLPIANGGTNATSAAAAFLNLAPSTTGLDGQLLMVDNSQTAGYRPRNAMSLDTVRNMGFAPPSFSAGAMTLATLDDGGTAHSANNVAKISFRSATASGSTTVRTFTSDISLVVPSGGTLGLSSISAQPLYLYLVDNAGTIVLGISPTLQDETKVYSTAAVSSTTSGTSAIYTASAITGPVAVRLFGKITATETTAGTWTGTGYDYSPISGKAPQQAVINLMTNVTSYGPAVIGAVTTPPTKGTVVVDTATWRRVGDTMEITYNYQQSAGGSAGSGAYLIPLPSGYTIDTTKQAVSTTGSLSVVGIGSLSLSASNPATSGQLASVVVYDSTHLALETAYSGTQAGFWSSSNFNLGNSVIIVSFKASVPIVQFSQAVTANIFDAGDFGWTSVAPLTIGATTSPPTKGTVVVDTCSYKRVGDTMQIQYNYQQSGAGSAGSGTYLIPIPAGKSIDTTKLALSTTGTLSVVGVGNLSISASNPTTSGAPVSVVAYNANNLAIQCSFSGTQAGFFASNNFNLGNAVVLVSFTVSVPILGWNTFPIGAVLGNSAYKVRISNSGSAAIVSQSSPDGSIWVTGVSRTGTGAVTITHNLGVVPYGAVTSEVALTSASLNGTPTSTTVPVSTFSTTAADAAFTLTCWKN